MNIIPFDGELDAPAAENSTDALSLFKQALTHVESGGNANAVSPQGARGTRQIMRGTFERYAKPGESFDNDDDRIRASDRKIEDDFAFYGGDLAKTAAAYVGGRGAVRSDGTIRSDVADAHGTTPTKYAQMVLARMEKLKASAPKIIPFDGELDEDKPGDVPNPLKEDGMTDPARQELPKGVKPSEAGAGRGSINPPLAGARAGDGGDSMDIGLPGWDGAQAPDAGRTSGVKPKAATSDLDTFKRGYADSTRPLLSPMRLVDGITAIAAQQRRDKGNASVLDNAAPVTGYDPATLNALSELPRLKGRQDEALKNAGRTSLEARSGTISPTGDLLDAATNIPGNLARGVGATALKALAIAPDVLPAIYPEGAAGNLRAEAARLDKNTQAANLGVSDSPLLKTGTALDNLIPSARDISKYVPEGIKQLAEIALIGPGAIIADAGVQGYDKSRTDGLSVGLSALAGGAQALTEGVPEALSARFAIHALDKVPMRAILSGDAKVLTQAVQRSTMAMGVELSSEQVSSLGNWYSDKVFADPTATPERLKSDLIDAFKATLIQGPTMIAGGKAMQAVANGIPAMTSKQKIERALADEFNNDEFGSARVENLNPNLTRARIDPVAAIGAATNVDEAIAAATAATQDPAQPAPPAAAQPAPAQTNPDIEQLNRRILELEALNAQPIEEVAPTPAAQSEPVPAPEAMAQPIAEPVEARAAPQPEPIAPLEPAAAPAPQPAVAAPADNAPVQTTPMAAPIATLKDNGTLDIQGDPMAIKAQLAEAGLKGIRTKTGMQVGKSQAAQAQSLFAPAAPIAQPATAVPTGPQQLGRDSQPLSEGGKPFKTRVVAAEAKKLQPMMRVVPVEGGFALAEKTPKQLAAEAKAAQRLRNPQTSAPGQPIPAHAFIAAEGGLHANTRADMVMEGNVRVGNRSLFAGAGKGLNIERATMRLIEEGYLPESASHNDARNLIKRSLNNPQYTPEGFERMAVAEREARFEDHLAAQQESASEPLPDEDAAFLALRGYTEPTAQELEEIHALMAIAEEENIDTLMAMLQADQLQDYANNQDYANDHADLQTSQYQPAGSSSPAQAESGRTEQGRSAAEPAGAGNGQLADRQEGAGQGAPAGQVEKDDQSAIYSANPTRHSGRDDGGRDVVRVTGVIESAAKSSQEIAGRVAPSGEVAQSPATQAAAILDAANITGKERIDVLKDVKKGDVTPEELQAAYPAEPKQASMPSELAQARADLAELETKYKSARGQRKSDLSQQIDRMRAAIAEREPVLTAPTQQDVLAQQDRAEAAAKSEKAQQRAADELARRERVRKDIAKASEAAADSFVLGGDAEQNLSGQGGMFDEPAPAAKPAAIPTDTPAFKAWFQQSKVVDSEGQPLAMYHGTSASQNGDAFTTFDTYASSYGLMGMGGYFTADPEVASSYTTKGKGKTPTVYKAFLSIQNPLDMDGPANAAAWKKQFPDAQAYHDGKSTNESWYRAAEEALTQEEIPSYEGAEIMQDGLRAMGFDGITHVGGGRVKSDGVKHRVYITFDPEQAKSATGNNGNFDPKNPDIRFSFAGQKGKEDGGESLLNSERSIHGSESVSMHPSVDGVRSNTQLFTNDPARKTIEEHSQRSASIERRGETGSMDGAAPVILRDAGVLGRDDAITLKRLSDRVLQNAKTLGDLANADAVAIHGYSVLDAPSKRVVMLSVIASGHDREVRKAIVTPDFVFMVNDIKGAQFTTKSLLDNAAVFRDALSINNKNAISALVDNVFSNSRSANAIAEIPLVSGKGGRGDPQIGRATIALDVDALIVASSDGASDFDRTSQNETSYVNGIHSLHEIQHTQTLRNQSFNGKEAHNAPAPANAQEAQPLTAEQARTVAAVERLASGLTAQWANAPEVIVAHDMQDARIPQAARLADAQQRRKGARATEGFYLDGKAYLLASQVSSPKDVARVIFHEVVGHAGLQGTFGQALDSVLEQIALFRKADVAAKATAYRLDMRDPAQRLQAAEEVLAEMAEKNPKFGLVKRAIAAIRNWLRAHVPGFKSLAMTDTDIAQAYLLPAKGWIERGRADSAKEAAPSFSRDAADQTDTPAFKAWFGKSAVVDSGGKPLVVYHGTGGDFSAFERKYIGSTWGADRMGFFFTDDKAEANTYAASGGLTTQRAEGSNIMPAYLSIKRPVDLQALMEFTGDDTIADRYESPIEIMDDFRDDIETMLLGDPQKNWHIDAESSPSKENAHDGVVFRLNGVMLAVAVESSQIKSAIGNNGDFDPANPDIRFSRSVPTPGPGLFQPTVWNAPEATKMDRFLFELQDNRIDLKRAQEAIKQSGQDIEEQFDARLAESLYAGRVAYRSQQFLAGEARPLLQAMELNKVTMNELADYLHARGAEERNKQIAKVNPKMPDGGAGTNTQGVLMTTQAARDYLANLAPARLAALTATARKVDAITAGTRKLLVSEGLEKQETIDAWEGAYKNYVPMFRDEADGMPPHPQGSGFSVRGSASQRATGSTKEVTNILAHVLMQREAAITRAEKNRVALSLYGLALSSPNPDFWTTIKPGMSHAQIAAELTAMGVDPMTAQVGMQGVPTIRTVDAITGKVVDRPNPMYKSLPGAITVKLGGEDRVLLLNIKTVRGLRLAESLKNLDGLTNLDIAGSIVGKGTRWIASVNTQYNPVFGISNVVRDTLGGAVHLSNTALRGKATVVLARVPAAMKGIASELASPGASGPWSALYRQFQADGAQTGFRENFRDPHDRAKAIEKELAGLGKGKLSPGKAAHAVLDVLDGFNTTMENAVRLSAYKTAIDQGISRAEAARLARELTVDFNRKGRAGRELGPLYAFFNASVQGNARTLQALKGPAGAKIILGGLSLGMMQAVILAMAGYDDDDIPEFVKTRSLIIPMPGEGKQFIAIPYPLGLHVLPNTGRVLAELALNGGKDIGKRTFNAVGEIAGAMNPLGGGNVFTVDGALKTLAPTLLDPAIELAANKSFSGNQIERKPFNEEGDNRPGHSRARESTQRSTTGQVYLGISKALNAASLGTDYEAGTLSPTPEQVRYLAQVVGGGVLRELEKSIDGTVKASRGEAVKPSATPLLGRFYGEVDADSVASSRYFDAKKKMDKAQSSLKAAEQAGDMAAYARLLEANPQLAAHDDLRKIQKTIGELNKLAVQTVNDPARLTQIDGLRFDQMKVLNEIFTQAENREPTLADRLKKR